MSKKFEGRIDWAFQPQNTNKWKLCSHERVGFLTHIYLGKGDLCTWGKIIWVIMNGTSLNVSSELPQPSHLNPPASQQPVTERKLNKPLGRKGVLSPKNLNEKQF